MIMMQDGVEVYCLPDGACCEADEKIRSPLNVEECPLGLRNVPETVYTMRKINI